MCTQGSVTHLIGQLKAGEHGEAQQELWNRYFRRLLALARKKLRGLPQRVEDQEDVVLSALDSFFRGTKEGRFPDLRDRTNLWPLLVVITERKAINQLRRQQAGKRGGGRVRGESVFIPSTGADERGGLADFADSEPTPAFAAQVMEELKRKLDALDNDQLRSLARMKFEGYTNGEIAKKLEVTERTVERKLKLIRKLWSEDEP